MVTKKNTPTFGNLFLGTERAKYKAVKGLNRLNVLNLILSLTNLVFAMMILK